METIQFSILASWGKELITAAKQATQTSYAPYSQFNVGAAVLLSDGTILTASNQENRAYSACVCAERVALLYATANYANTPVTAIAVAASQHQQFTAQPVTPCGECRQVLVEMQERFNTPIQVLMYGEQSCYIARNAQELLPAAF